MTAGHILSLQQSDKVAQFLPPLHRLRNEAGNGICCMAQETQTVAVCQPSGLGWGGRREGGSKGKGYTYTYG